MSCLLGALDDKKVKLSPSCEKAMQERKQLWESAAQVRFLPLTTCNSLILWNALWIIFDILQRHTYFEVLCEFLFELIMKLRLLWSSLFGVSVTDCNWIVAYILWQHVSFILSLCQSYQGVLNLICILLVNYPVSHYLQWPTPDRGKSVQDPGDKSL